MKVNLKSKVISDDFEVYSLFPGEGYKHRTDMLNRGYVFLDFPDLVIPSKPSEFESKNFLSAVVMSEQLAGWLSGPKDANNKPSSNLSDYANVRQGSKRSRYINGLKALFFKARKGELVLLPDRGAYGELMIGELSTDVGKIEYIQPSGMSQKFAARRVKWLSKISQHKISAEFLRSIRTPNALTLVQNSYRKQIFENAYDSYTIGSYVSARFIVSGHEYDVRDDFNFSRFTNYMAALYESYDTNAQVVIPDNILTRSMQ